jgi:hypothetical protein
MSTDWDVACVECGDEVGIRDANHMEDLMWEYVKAAPQIAALGVFRPDARVNLYDTHDMRYAVRAGWFAEHAGHTLKPRNEYGHWAGQCSEYVKCSCGSTQRCKGKSGHDGEHSPVQP